MTENTPEAPEGATPATTPATPEFSTPAPSAAVAEYKPTPPKSVPDAKRHAVWDTTLERYVGEVFDTKPTAAQVRELAPNGGKVIGVG